MNTTNAFNNHVQAYPEDYVADLTDPTVDETDDLEEFPVLLQSGDVRDLIEAAAKRGLSAPALTRRLVRDFLSRTRGTSLVRSISANGSR